MAAERDHYFQRFLDVRTAERLKQLASDEAVIGFFADEERRLVNEIVASETSEYDRREDAAAKLRALRSLQRFISGKISLGERSAEKLNADREKV